MTDNSTIVIGSYAYRGNVNLARLLMEYLHIPYQNMLFNPNSWRHFKETKAKEWAFQELPFLIDKEGGKELIITQAMPITEYIIKKSGKLNLLGVGVQDSLIVDQVMWGKDFIQSLLSIVVSYKKNYELMM